MIPFEKFTLDNGLKVIVNHDPTTPIITVDVLYNVGSKDEDPDKTGFAHLFEHLMFGGSRNIPDYDTPLEKVGGENNAFTNTDITNFFLSIPKPNLETAFWLESDRMLDLAISEKKLENQKSVVSEEYRQRYINQPYGDTMLHLRPLVYKKHPYRWPTIGRDINHIEKATLDDVKAFYEKFYNPNNAILSLSGNITADEARPLIEKWFGPIPSGANHSRSLPRESPQKEKRFHKEVRDVPHHHFYKAYRMVARNHKDFFVYDLISDILANGDSSRLHQKLVKEKNIFSNIDAYITGEIEPGMLIISGNIANGSSAEEAEKAVDEELERLKNEPVGDSELQKVKNKAEATMEFGKLSSLNKAYLLAYFELLGDAGAINEQVEKFRAVSAEDILRVSQDSLKEENASVLYYLSKHLDK
ncbi:MAG: insulinase family protein [Bacteroidales bacterium]|nr:insulinase family protein [Bacteroidales bacterium]